MARRFKPFTPYIPQPPPAGSYDPALDAQRAAAGRGLLDLTQDVGRDNTRDTVDYGISRDSILRGQDRGLADLSQSRDRGLADLSVSQDRGLGDIATQRGQAGQDHARQLELLSRSFALLGGRQQEQANQAGVLQGGALLQAAAKRAANQGIQQQAIDTQYGRVTGGLDQAQSRLLEDAGRTQQRIGQDFQTQSGRLGENTQLDLGKLGLDMAPPDANNPFGGRRFQDRTTQLTRAQRENTAFGLDLEGQRAFQAAGAGWTPPGRGEPGGPPANEFVDGLGNPYRTITRGNTVTRIDQLGKVLSERRRRR